MGYWEGIHPCEGGEDPKAHPIPCHGISVPMVDIHVSTTPSHSSGCLWRKQTHRKKFRRSFLTSESTIPSSPLEGTSLICQSAFPRHARAVTWLWAVSPRHSVPSSQLPHGSAVARAVSPFLQKPPLQRSSLGILGLSSSRACVTCQTWDCSALPGKQDAQQCHSTHLCLYL